MKQIWAAVFLIGIGVVAVCVGSDENAPPAIREVPGEAMHGLAEEGADIPAHAPQGAAESPAEPPVALPTPPAVATEAPGDAGEGPPQPPAARRQPVERGPCEVVNASFEKDLDGWQVAPGVRGGVEADPAAAKSGKFSARLSITQPDSPSWLAQDIPLARAAGKLGISYWARPALSGPARIVAKLEFFDAAGCRAMTRYLQHIARDAREWQQASGEVVLPATVTSLRLTLRLVGAGAAWVDDVSVKFRPQTLLVWPQRLACVEGQPRTVELDCWAKPEGPLTAKLDGQNEVALSAEGDKSRVELPALTIGRHLLTIMAGEAKDEIEVWCVPGARRPKNLSEAGFWLLKQKPGLASLVHHASLPDLAELTAHGFSIAEIMAPDSPDGLSRMLRPIPKQLAPVLVSFAVPGAGQEEDWRARVLQTIRANASEQRIAGWLLASEPDVQLTSVPFPQLYLDAKKADGLHPLAVMLAGTEEIDFWRAFADVVVINCCGFGEDPAGLAEALRQARSKLELWQALGAMLPAGWGPGAFQADAAQAKVLAFSAIAGGASVVAWYALRATGWDLRASTVWPALRDINQAMAKLSETVVGHQAAEDVVVAGEGVLWRAWADGDVRTVLLVNATPGAVAATAKVRDGALTRPASLVYEVKPAASGDGLSVSLQPGAVALIRGHIGPAGAPEVEKPAPAGPAPEESQAEPAPPTAETQTEPPPAIEPPQVEPEPPTPGVEQPPGSTPEASPFPPDVEPQQAP